MKSIFQFFKKQNVKSPALSLADYWAVNSVTDEGFLHKKNSTGLVFEASGIDANFLSSSQLESLHQQWRSALRMSPGEEMQIIFRKRVEFSKWVEEQMNQAFLSDNAYGRRIILDRLAEQVSQMSQEEPRLLSHKIIICFWVPESVDVSSLNEKKNLIESQLNSFGIQVKSLDKAQIEKEIYISAQDLSSSEQQEAEWPLIKIEAGHLNINEDIFRALELSQLPESFTELGMIQSLTSLPYPLDLCVRLKARDTRPIISRLERKRNMLNAQRTSKNSPSPNVDSQIEQIDYVLRDIAEKSESIFDMNLTLGLRLPKKLASFQRKALAVITRAAAQMDLCIFEESTLSSFDSYLECLPGFSGKNKISHTVLGSNALHFLPFFRPAKGDKRAVAVFQTRNSTLYGIDPVDAHLANYNWLVSGTSGAGKSFFVNSLLAQSSSIDPNIFIVDIGGSYNKLTQYLGGKVMSLAPGQGFELSPFFLAKNKDPTEERMRRQHIFQIFLEMTRVDGKLPPIEVRHLLNEQLEVLFEKDKLPDRPISYLLEVLSKVQTSEARRLQLLLEPWGKNSFYSQFLDNSKALTLDDKVLTFDLKGLTDFEDLSRVVQLIVCASLWARVRQSGNENFSWIVLDEVAFSLLKTQPEFVDELVSTLRKYYAGAVVVVQDLEKVTSNLAGSSILQNTQTKAILQQRGNPKNYSDILSLNQIDQWAIESLRREKGVYSDIFLIRDDEKTVIRHVPSSLEYWLATSAPEDNRVLTRWTEQESNGFRRNITDFIAWKKGAI